MEASADADRKEYSKLDNSPEQDQHDSGCEQSPTTLSPSCPSTKADEKAEDNKAEDSAGAVSPIVYDRV